MTIHLENPRGNEFYYRVYGETDWVRLLKGDTLIPEGMRCEISPDAINVIGMLISLAEGEGGVNTANPEPIRANERQRVGEVGTLIYAKGY